jgi:hypothetical protein
MIMAGRGKNDLDRRIDGLYSVCEKILLRTLIFACFVDESEGLPYGCGVKLEKPNASDSDQQEGPNYNPD